MGERERERERERTGPLKRKPTKAIRAGMFRPVEGEKRSYRGNSERDYLQMIASYDRVPEFAVIFMFGSW